jgi:hypothetical protein
MQCKNCNIETRSHDYVTIDERVFSPCRAEVCRAVTSRASPRLVYCHATAINTWMSQEWGWFTWSRQQCRHAFQQWRNNWGTVGRSVSRTSNQGFIGETEARLLVSSLWDITVEGLKLERFWSCELKTLSVNGSLSLCVIFGVICSAISYIFNFVTRTGLVCVTVNNKV